MPIGHPVENTYIETPPLAPSASAQMRSSAASSRRRRGEGHQQHALRIGTPDNEMRDPMGERVHLSGAGARDDEQRAAGGGRRAVMESVLDRAALFGFGPFEIGDGGHAANRWGERHGGLNHDSCFVRNYGVSCGK